MTENNESRSWRYILAIDVSPGDTVLPWGVAQAVYLVEDRFNDDHFGTAIDFSIGDHTVTILYWSDDDGNCQYVNALTLDSRW